MKSRNITIRKNVFKKFEFALQQEKEFDEDGKATISMSLPDREEERENQLILMKMEIFYPDSQYKVTAEMDAVYSVKVADLPEDISQDSEFQRALVSPMIEKFKLYVGLFSEGAYGAIQIPDLNFNQD
ncbi:MULTISPECIES: hypothetical protein [unclassified Streptococcus]|uniref:hypothetical protein n=3 Tax=unclassified Streptococcus TaxID=2608887 RepID=UPI00211B59C3|nr:MULTISPECIES: hypothetical protein [unclassified Streptococcus]MCQ9212298.1 hypothetical protein [Streptococcus sp. B01]MCQ9213629.1 hypothetical protein [Streptococcus sp. O1]